MHRESAGAQAAVGTADQLKESLESIVLLRVEIAQASDETGQLTATIKRMEDEASTATIKSLDAETLATSMEVKIAELMNFNNTLTRALTEYRQQEKARSEAETARSTGVQSWARAAAGSKPSSQTPAPPAAKADGAMPARVSPPTTSAAPLRVGRQAVQSAALARKAQDDEALGPGQAAAAAKVLGVPIASTLGEAGADAEAPPLSQPSRSVPRPVPQGIPAGGRPWEPNEGRVGPSTETRTKHH